VPAVRLPAQESSGGVAASVCRAVQDALMGVLRSGQPAAVNWRRPLVEALAGIGARDAAEAAIARLDRQASNNVKKDPRRGLRECPPPHPEGGGGGLWVVGCDSPER
jgi:hypothetical protein